MRAIGGRYGRLLAVVVGAGIVVGLCTAPAPEPPLPVPVAPRSAQVAMPPSPSTVLGTDDPVSLAVATSSALFTSAPVAVLAAVDDGAGQAAAAPVAERIGVPLLLTSPDGDPAGVGAELGRLGAVSVLAVGDRAARWAALTSGSANVVTDERLLPVLTPPAPRPSVLVLVPEQGQAGTLAAAVTARASGARTIVVPGGDPRGWSAQLPQPSALQSDQRQVGRVLALGTGFGSSELLARRLAVAATGVQLPGGGQVIFPGRRFVALYGHPGAPALGVLGEQGVAASIARAQALAAQYQPWVGEPVVPAFEIIATVADSGPGPDRDYSAEATVDFLRPWVEAAGAAGLYVMLDLQPGRADFLTQARRYEPLLAQPHVGLALDPEWRLRPDQRHREQIGSVPVEEINSVITWFADLTRDRGLPQKLLMIHQFRTSMIVGRDRLDTSRDELCVLIHADGFGTPGMKVDTWNALHHGEPAGIRWGWKNFYDEDQPMFTPAETMAIGPTSPVFVSYQ